jgi:hypothetical protein
MVLGAFYSFCIEKIEAQGIFLRFYFAHESVAQKNPFLLSNLTFKNRFLHTRPIIFAGLGDFAESSLAGFFNRSHIIGDEDQHGDCRYSLFGNQGQIIRYISAKMPGENTSLDKRELSKSKVLFQHRMGECFLFAQLVSLDDRFSATPVNRA